MHVREPPEHAGEALAHLLTAHIALAGGLRSRTRLEDALRRHEGHEEVDVVTIPAVRERFQVLNGHRHCILRGHAKVALVQLRVKRGIIRSFAPDNGLASWTGAHQSTDIERQGETDTRVSSLNVR